MHFLRMQRWTVVLRQPNMEYSDLPSIACALGSGIVVSSSDGGGIRTPMQLETDHGYAFFTLKFIGERARIPPDSPFIAELVVSAA